MDNPVDIVLELARNYVPSEYSYAPHGVCGALSLGSLFVLWRGARMISFIVTMLFIGGGLVAGHNVAFQFSLPLWPITALGGALGLAFGALLSKLWLAILLAACFATLSFSVYAYQVIGPQMSDYYSEAESISQFHVPSEKDGLISKANGAGQFWDYLVANVPQVRLSIGAVLLSGAIAGLVIGLLLPKTSKAIAAATTGTLILAGGLYGLAYFYKQAHQLKEWGWWPLGVVGGVWLISLLVNILDQRPAKAQKSDPDPEDGEPAAA